MGSIQLKGIHKSFGELAVIKGVDIHINDGEFVVFVGPSGCGKSTLLRMIAGLEEISSGTVSIDGVMVGDLPSSKRGLAMVFQSYALYPHMSVYKNLAFGLKLAKRPKQEIQARVEKAAKILQITDYLERLPKALSGGQRQRVAIGRAIVREPKAFLFDEPLSNLDAALRSDMRVELSDLHKKLEATIVYVTHDQVEAMTLADKIVVLNAGRVEQIGTPLELYTKPDTLFVAGFIGSPRMNFLKGKIATDKGADICGVRPEHITLSEEGGDIANHISGHIRHVEMLGAETLLHIDTTDHGTLLVSQPTLKCPKDPQGKNVFLSPQTEQQHFFKDGARLDVKG